MPKIPVMAIAAIVLFALLLWAFFAWASGAIRFGGTPVPTGPSAFEQTSAAEIDVLSRCLSRNYTGRLRLVPVDTHGANIVRFWRRDDVIVDVARLDGDDVVIRIYPLNDRLLRNAHRVAVQSCIPEAGLPAAGDPRNREFYARAMRD